MFGRPGLYSLPQFSQLTGLLLSPDEIASFRNHPCIEQVFPVVGGTPCVLPLILYSTKDGFLSAMVMKVDGLLAFFTACQTGQVNAISLRWGRSVRSGEECGKEIHQTGW